MSSDDSQTPTGELNSRRVADTPCVDLASVEYIVYTANIAEAWKKVKANKGAPGVDGISIGKFAKWARPKWNLFKKQLLEGTYEPSPVLRVEIPKESGGMRKLGIPTVFS